MLDNLTFWLIITLLCFSFAIVSIIISSQREKYSKKVRDTAIIYILIFFFLTFVSGITLVVKATKQFFFATLESLETETMNGLFASYDNPQLNTLMKLQPQGIDFSKIPSIWKCYMGSVQDIYRTPLIYPYALYSTMNSENSSCFLVNEKNNILNITTNPEWSIRIFDFINKFTFDSNILLANTTSGQYIIFHFNSAHIEEFSSDTEMYKRAVTLQFDTTQHLGTFNKYHSYFFENTQQATPVETQ